MIKRRIWAVICGAVRLEFELYSVIALLCEWRSRGVLEGIVLSTWKGEVDKIQCLRKKLAYLDIPLIESTPLDESEGKYTNLNFVRQATQLNAALNFIPVDVFVLKCRTDFCVGVLNHMISFLDRDMEIRPFGAFRPPLRHRIAVRFTSVSSPYFSGDIVFFGHKADIRAMLVFENTVWSIGYPCNPDGLFFRNIFIRDYPIINEYTRIIRSFPVNVILRDKLSAFSKEDFYLPGILNKFYALHFVILYCCFALPETGRISSNSFYSVFHKETVADWQVALDHPATLKRIVFGEFEHTNGFNKLCDEIHKISVVPGYAREMDFNEDDYQETLQWGKHFDTPVGSWLNWKRCRPGGQSNINFDTSSKILFADYQMPESALSAIKEVVVNNTDYYGKLSKSLDVFENCDKALYEKALFTAARGQDGNVLKRLGKLLFEGKLKDERAEEAAMVFERYKGKDVFYKTAALTAGKLIGVYYYGKYAGNDYAQVSWRVLKREWGMSDEEPEDYSDGLIELARKKLDGICHEIQGNRLVKVLTEFLSEVCETNPFRSEYKEILEGAGEKELLERIERKEWKK